MAKTMITIPSQPVTPAWLSRPDGEAKGGVIVIHEVWGLTDHIKSVADRFATAGYLALAPDLFSETEVDTGAMEGLQEALFDPEQRNQIQPELRKLMTPLQKPEFGATVTTRLQACFEYLYNLPEAHQRVAVVGFCFGGTYSFSLAVEEPRLKLAVPFYGHSDDTADELKHITCPIRAFYGEQDERLFSGLPDLTAKMKAAGVDFEAKVYPACGHAFFNDSNPHAYNPEAAQDAWKATLDLLASHLQ
jgi:carboxymethylenebutenolidase